VSGWDAIVIGGAQIVRAWAGIEARMPDHIPIIAELSEMSSPLLLPAEKCATRPLLVAARD